MWPNGKLVWAHGFCISDPVARIASGLDWRSPPAQCRTSRLATLVALSHSPYAGGPHATPGTIQAENHDNGGEYVSSHDVTYGNDRRQYRWNDVDIQTSADTADLDNIKVTGTPQ